MLLNATIVSSIIFDIFSFNSDNIINLIEDLQMEIKSLPKKKLTLEYVIAQLAPQISDAIKNKSYSYEEICQLLNDKKNIIIKPSTLKSYLQKANPLKQSTHHKIEDQK